MSQSRDNSLIFEYFNFIPTNGTWSHCWHKIFWVSQTVFAIFFGIFWINKNDQRVVSTIKHVVTNREKNYGKKSSFICISCIITWQPCFMNKDGNNLSKTHFGFNNFISEHMGFWFTKRLKKYYIWFQTY